MTVGSFGARSFSGVLLKSNLAEGGREDQGGQEMEGSRFHVHAILMSAICYSGQVVIWLGLVPVLGTYFATTVTAVRENAKGNWIFRGSIFLWSPAEVEFR